MQPYSVERKVSPLCKGYAGAFCHCPQIPSQPGHTMSVLNLLCDALETGSLHNQKSIDAAKRISRSAAVLATP